MIEYIYIDRQDQLDLAISQLDKADFLSVDTESSSFYTYYSELCLIQISSNRLNLVIDALASLDLSGLGKLFNGLSILKIFHDAPADMTELHRRYHWPIHRIFDTHLAAKYLNHESCSLLALAKYYIGVQLEKKEQKSNWLKRPLSKSQLDYAHLDTLYLQPIQDQMTASLKKSNLYIEFESEMDWLVSNLDFTNTKEESDPANDWLKVKGASKLLPEKRGKFRALYDLREEYAKQVNVAPFRIVNNRSLLQVISEMPRTVGELQLYGFQTAFLKKEANQILDALHKSEPIYDLPKLNIRNKADRDPEVEKRFYKLKEWREKMVSKRKFEPTLILSSRILKTIAKENPTSLNELEALRLMSKWKLAEYGPELLKVI